MFIRELTIDFSPANDKIHSPLAEVMEPSTNKWFGSWRGGTKPEIFNRILRSIINGIDNTQYHWWR